MRRHWGAVALFAVAAASVFAGAVFVFLWFVSTAQSSGLVPSTLSLWTMSNLVNFILYSIFWELLLIGVPVAIGGVAGWLWWRRLPYDEKSGYFFGGRSRSTRGGGGVSLLLFIAFALKVYLDGKWNTAIASFSVDYVVGSILTILVWGLVIFGIPAAIASAWWLRREMTRA